MSPTAKKYIHRVKAIAIARLFVMQKMKILIFVDIYLQK